MRRGLFAASVMVLLSASIPATADLLYHDAFLIGPEGDYIVGPLIGQNPSIGPTPFLSGPWQGRPGDPGPGPVVQDAALHFFGFESLGGSVLSPPGSRAGRLLTTPLNAATTGTYYISYLVDFGQGYYDDGVTNDDMGFRVVEMWDAGGQIGNDIDSAVAVGYSAYNGLPGNRDPETARMFLRVPEVPDVIIGDSPDSFEQDNTTHLIVLKFILSNIVNQDVVQLFLDPTTSDEPFFPSAQVSNANFTLGSVGVVSTFGGTGTFPVLDELRLATTFAEAMPPLPDPFEQCGGGDAEACYNLIFENLNTVSSEGDLSGDGKVTIKDYRLWKDFMYVGAGITAVPEPSAFALAVGALLLTRRRLLK